ncbi:MAG: ATP-binding protein [Bacteroidales bacterium]|nr:ATP-binding protein [Bacteroidales bacterium]MBO7463761.1 ATP-binding protein [Bacteroidales bacterium]
MLLDFSVRNFRSFYETKSFSMEAQPLKEAATENVAKVLSYNVLKTIAFYGANSSGKSNLIYALAMMRYVVISSVKLNPNDTLQYEPFLLLRDNSDPTLFEVTFLKEGFCYRYGFSYNKKDIVEEWLFRKTTPRSKEQALFIRNNDGIAYEDKRFPEGIGLESRVNNNRLFLSLCAQLGGEISSKMISCFKGLLIVSGLLNQEYAPFSKLLFRDGTDESERALDFFKKLQLGFEDISVYAQKEEQDSFDLDVVKRIKIESIHRLYDENGEACGHVNFPFNELESSGTRKLFDMSGVIFNALERGDTLIIDELDAKMHPLISQQIIKLFNDPKTNPKNAQLIFTTHDTHLLSSKMLRRDQIWFTEKNDEEQTDLYCLTDIVLSDGTKPRNDANYEKNYIAGRYGAIPYIVND